MVEFLAIAVPAISGLFWLAYHHPSAANKVAVTIGVFGFLFGMGATVWETAVSRTYINLIPLIQDDKMSTASKIVDGMSLPYGMVMGIFLGSAALVIAVEQIGKLKGTPTDKKK